MRFIVIFMIASPKKMLMAGYNMQLANIWVCDMLFVVLQYFIYAELEAEILQDLAKKQCLPLYCYESFVWSLLSFSYQQSYSPFFTKRIQLSAWFLAPSKFKRESIRTVTVVQHILM